MDSLTFNKVFAGILMAGLMALVGIKLAEILVPHEKLASNAYPIEVTEVASTSSAPAAPAGPEPVLALLANADVAAGEKLAKKCTAAPQ